MQILMPKDTKKRATPCEMAQTTKPLRAYENPQVKDTYEPLICAEATVNCVDKTFSIGFGSMPERVNS